jgi:hypothetical protein
MPTGGAGHFWFAEVSVIAGVRVLRWLIKVEAKQADERADWHLSQMESAVRASVWWLLLDQCPVFEQFPGSNDRNGAVFRWIVRWP